MVTTSSSKYNFIHQTLSTLSAYVHVKLCRQSACSMALSETSWATASARAFIIPQPEQEEVAPDAATARKGSFLRALPDRPSQSAATFLHASPHCLHLT